MVLLKVMIALQVAITIISSPGNYRLASNNKEEQTLNKRKGYNQILSDTIKFADNDYKLLFDDEYAFDIELTNLGKSIELTFKKNPIIQLSSKAKTYIAKGILVTTSAVPPKCDMFFTVGKDGRILYDGKNKIKFIKVRKNKPW